MERYRRPVRGRGVTISIALVVACLGLPEANALAAPSTTTTFPASVVVAGNAYARQLLARQPIPSAARKVAVLPTRLAPSDGISNGDSVSHAWALYLLPMSVSVNTFVRDHLPVGEKVTETGSGYAPNTNPVYNFGLSLTCVSPHIVYCGVFYTTTEAKNGEQELRVDTDVSYLPIIHALMPTSGVVTITGYATTSVMNPSSDPTSVVLTHHQVLNLASVVAELKDFGGGMCMEDSQLLKIAIVKSGHVVWRASADECPGVLVITSGSLTLSLDARSCAFWHVVNSFFAPGTAKGTKSGSRVCADASDG